MCGFFATFGGNLGDHDACGIIHRQCATIPSFSMARRGDSPGTGRTEVDFVEIDFLAVVAFVNRVDGVVDQNGGAHWVDVSHGFARGKVFKHFHNGFVTHDNDLAQGVDDVSVKGEGRVDPTQRGREGIVAVGNSGKVGDRFGRVVEDLGRHIVEDGVSTAVVVDFVDHKPAVAAAAPALKWKRSFSS